MSSGSKFARGTGRGQFRPPHNRGLVQLRHGPASSKKTSLGQPRDISGPVGVGNGGASSTSREESFQLLAQPSTMGRPFAMIIRLQPEILEELKQVEAEGLQASMKFGTNATGHVIQVASETFKFSSAPEPGDLCDIYEQKQGESGEAVLVEAGSAWRKLSVQRILSATEKDRVKKRTAEAEHRQKQRKSILVDSSTQMIIPQAGAAEANGRKPLPKLTKEPPPKKRRVTTSPSKQRPHSSTAVVPGNRQFASPASPSFDPPMTNVRGIQANQMSDPHPPKARAVSERIGGPIPSKGPSLQKEKPRTPVASAASDSAKCGSATNLTDLRNFLIGLMQENPKGVTIKAIEKAVAEGLSGVADKRALEKVMKSIVSFHAPGKYLLNPGVEKGNYLEPVPPSNSARAQEAVRPIAHEAEPSNAILEKESAKEKEEPPSFEKGLSSTVSHHSEHSTKETSPKRGGAQPFDSNIMNEALTKQDATHGSKDPSTGGSESSSSSGSGSGSGSDSDSSGSDSGTDSGSGSGSGSESDSSSSSSGPSMDEDVDIMSDDDVEKGKLDAKQKPKGRESKSAAREDSRTHETNKSEEETHTSSLDNPSLDNPLEPAAALDQANDTRPDALAKVSDNIIESVFGTDEIDDFEEDSGEPTRGDQSRQGHVAPLQQYEEQKVPGKSQSRKEHPKERNNFEETQRISTRDNDALGLEEQLDILVEKISESKDMGYGSLGGNRGGLSSSQQEHHKPQLKSGGPGPGKDNDNRRVDDASRSNLDKRDCGVYSSSDGRSTLISGRQSRDFETQHLQQRDLGGPSKVNVHRVSRESSSLGGRHERDSPNVDKSSKVPRQSRQKSELLDRAGLVVEQAERPLVDMDSTRRGKDMYGKATFKDLESGGRLSSGETSSLVPKGTTRYGESGRSQVRENCRPVSQVVEMRDPPFENGNLELKKGLPSMEDSRSKATSGAKNRVPYKGSTSPDQDGDLLPLDRRSLELAKQSPVRTFEDSRHHAYEARSTKRRPEEIENSEMERSKRRAGAAHIRQPQHRDEWFHGGSVKQSYIEKGRFSASDSQEYAGTSKFSALENSVRSDEELDESYKQQRVIQTRAASNEMRRDNLKAGDSLDTSKRQTPQSTEEVEGCEFFAPYEKKKPDLRGLINTFQEYKEYCKEYREKYPIYIRLNGVIENNKKPFESLRKDMERARNKDDEKKLAHTSAKVRREYALRHKKRKRMFHTFRILHEELKAIKNRCKEYAEKVEQS